MRLSFTKKLISFYKNNLFLLWYITVKYSNLIPKQTVEYSSISFAIYSVKTIRII